MTYIPEETPEERASWQAFLKSPEFDKLLAEALADTGPTIHLSTPEDFENLRKAILKERK